nr:hypothetical protein GCM10020093_088010 [Planobispora longispora]
MNGVIAGISYRSLLGRRRVWLLVLLPVVLLALAVLLRVIGADGERATVTLLQTFAIGTMLPLLGVIAGTGVIAPEIDDGTVIHLLSKPISRPVVAQTKFLVAASVVAAFAAVPTFAAAYLLVGLESGWPPASPWPPSSAAWRTRRCSCCWAWSPGTRSRSASSTR